MYCQLRILDSYFMMILLILSTIIGGKNGVDRSSDDDVADFVDDDKSYDKYDDFEDHKAITTDDI